MNAKMPVTETKTRTRKAIFNGEEITLSFLEGGKYPTSVTEKDGTNYHICNNRVETIYRADNAKFKIANYTEEEEEKKDRIKKIVNELCQFVIEGNSLVKRLMPAYFRAGIFFKSGRFSRLITRAFFNKDGNPKNLPFGKIVLGSIEIQKCTMYNREERIIINYHFGRVYDHQKDGQFKWKEIKFLPQIPEKCEFSLDIFPGEKNTTYIVVK